MAVSDYRVKMVTSMANIEKAIKSGAEIEPIKCDANKITSATDDLTLIMERTPKVISLYHKLHLVNIIKD
jgi:hypothetical protein